MDKAKKSSAPDGDLQTQLQRLKSENRLLRQSRNSFRNDNKLLSIIEGKLRYKLEMLAKRLKDLNGVTAKFSFASENMSLEELIEHLVDHLNDLAESYEQKKRELESARTASEKTRENFKQQKEKLVKEIEDIKLQSQKKLEEQQDEIQKWCETRLHLSTKNKNKDWKDLVAEHIENLNKNKDNSGNKLQQCEEELRRLQEKLRQLEKECTDFGTEVLHLSMKDVSPEEAFSNVYSAVRKQIKQMKLQDENIKELNNNLTQVNDQLSEQRNIVSNLSKKSEQLSSEKSQTESQLQNLQENYNSKEKLLEERERELHNLEESRRTLENQGENLQTKLKEAEKKIKENNEEITKCKGTIQELNQHLQKELDTVKKLEEQNQENKKKYENDRNEFQEKLNTQEQKHKSGTLEKNIEIEKLNEDLSTSKEEQNRLKNHLDNQREMMQKAEQEWREQLKNLQEQLRKQEEEKLQALKEYAEYKNKTEQDNKVKQEEKLKLTQDYQSLQNELNKTTEIKNNLEQQKQNLQNELESKLKQFNELKNEMEGEISRLKKLDEQRGLFEQENLKLKDDIVNLKKILEQQNAGDLNMKQEIAKLQKQNEQYSQEIERLKSLVNKPKTEIGVQTESDYEKTIAKAIEQKFHDRIDLLQNENVDLMQQINKLIADRSKFYDDANYHKGEVACMVVSPSEYKIATGGADWCVRLWKFDNNIKGFTPFVKAVVDGKILSIAYNSDGKYLAAGCALEGGPNGYVVIWDCSSNTVCGNLRSRPTQRFGRVHCVGFVFVEKSNTTLILGGDTTGKILVWDLHTRVQIAQLEGHKDIVYDLTINKHRLLSCSHDQSVAYFPLKNIYEDSLKKLLNKIGGMNKRKSNKALELNNNTNEKEIAAKLEFEKSLLSIPSQEYKMAVIYRDDKYPLFCITLHDDGKSVILGSRKLKILELSSANNDEEKDNNKIKVKAEEKLAINDTDLEHIKNVYFKKNLILVRRSGLNRCKLFDLNGKLLQKIETQNPPLIAHVGITSDLKYTVICSGTVPSSPNEIVMKAVPIELN